MTDPVDNRALADRFLRLWEESWQQIAQDPQVSRYWADLFAALQRSLAVGAGATGARTADEPAGREGNADGPAPAAAPPVDGSDRVGELERRVAELERRVADLAAALEGSGRRRG